jgi:SacI restriction endonuclease
VPCRPIEYGAVKQILTEQFAGAEEDFRNNTPVAVAEELQLVVDTLFESRTQAYRETLIGCALARISDRKIDITRPYANQGEDAFNGRTLDEKVVNPFLQENQIPCSKGPYLSAFRRSVQFIRELPGQRDRQAYGAFMDFIDALKSAPDEDVACSLLRYLLYRFVLMRNAAHIVLRRIRRLSIEQYESLIDALLHVPSGGRFPVLLAVATFQTIKGCFGLDWSIEWQGINVADRASGVGGDITIWRDSKPILAVEITQRPIDRSRVVSTFNTKILPSGIDDYLFLFSVAAPTDDARAAAR